MYSRDIKPVYKNLSDKEFDKHVKWCLKNRPICIDAKYQDLKNTFENKYEFNRRYPSGMVYFFKKSTTKMYLTYKKGDSWFNFYYNSNNPEGGELVRSYTGGDAYRHLQQYAHIPDLTGKYGYDRIVRKGNSDQIVWAIKNIMPKPYKNEQYKNKELYVYCYDKHRAFLEACFGLYPDTTVEPKLMSRVGKNEVGFDEDGIPILEDDGHSHLYVFPLVKNPGIEKWARTINDQILELKESDGTDENKQKLYDLKHEYTDAIGMICRHNPFFHNMIVYRSMEIMEKLYDENTIYSVTDSIISLTKRNDLNIGKDMGQFELECEGKFIMKGQGYIIYNDTEQLKKSLRGPDCSKNMYLGEDYSDYNLDNRYKLLRVYLGRKDATYMENDTAKLVDSVKVLDNDYLDFEDFLKSRSPGCIKKANIKKDKFKEFKKEQFKELSHILVELDNQKADLIPRIKFCKQEIEQKQSAEYREYNPDDNYIKQVIEYNTNELKRYENQLLEIDKYIKEIEELSERLQNEEI